MDKVLNDIKKIALNYKNINKIVLFGSRARGDNTDKSDYDIAVFAAMDYSDECRFKDDIDNIETFYKIDILFVKERHIGTDIYKNIMNDGVIIMDRFQTKLNNYQKALVRLHESIEESKASESLTVRDGVIQRFEFTTELAWKTIREYLLIHEVSDINTPKNVMSAAFSADIITDEQGWLAILRNRNSTSYIYDEADADRIYQKIVTDHIKLFDELKDILTEKSKEM